MATELATAYVNLVPSTSAMGKEMSKYFKGLEDKSEETGKQSGTQFTRAFGKWAKRGIAVGAAAVGAVAGAALVSGLRSGIDQQQGQAVLGGLYGDAEKASKTLEDLKKVSARSPLDFSGYQGAAESLAYAGVEGSQAIGVLENVGKVITAAGGDTQQLEQATGGVMKAVNNGGIAMMDSLGMISESGVPILSGLAEHFGVGIDEVKKMASEGKVNITDVMSVMENATGDTFQQMLTAGDAASETFSSQWKIAKDNVQVALGETLLPLIEKITPLIEPMGDAVVAAVERMPEIGQKIEDGFAWIGENMSWIKPIAMIIGGIALAFGLYSAAMGIAAGATTLWGAAVQFALGPINWIILGIGLLVGALVWFFTQTEVGQEIWEKVWGAIKAAAGAVWGWIRDTLWPGIVTAWDAIAAGAVWLYENAIRPAWDGIKAAISAVVGWLVNTAWPVIKGVWDAIAGAAVWLWQSVLKPVWDGIKLAIAIAVTAIMVYIDLLKWYFTNVIAPAAMWLWNNVMKPVWNGIKTAIGAVVDWFKNTAWPIFSNVVNWLRTKFEQFKRGLSIIWSAIKNNVINPIVTWFKNTAWPLISGVIDRLKAGFQSMKDRLKAIWDGVKNSVIAPVANWLTDTLAPKIERVTDNIKKAFDVMKDGVKKAWDGIKDAARAPAKFVVEDVYDATIKETFNGVASKLGLKTRLPGAKIGFASGGVLPGYTPGRDVHDFVSPTGGRLSLSGGEAIMRPEFTRAVGGAAGVAALNRKARRGEAFKDGGIWGSIKGLGGDAWDWLKDQASTITEALGDPMGVFTKLADKAMDLVPGAGMVREIVQQAGTNAAKSGGEWLRDRLFNSDGGGGTVPQAGQGSGGWGKANNAAAQLGLRMTSGYRPGARTAGNGIQSMHALGRARDYAGSASAMRAFFNQMDGAPFPTELLYTPMGGRNIHRSGRRYSNTGATARNHYDHVHVAFKNGGIFDQGGLMQPGMTGINLTRKPEAVLDPAQTRAYQAHAESVARNDGEMTLSARSIEDLADALSMRPNVVQIGTRQAGQLALAGAGANRAMGGRL